jgi:hypothetical protein
MRQGRAMPSRIRRAVAVDHQYSSVERTQSLDHAHREFLVRRENRAHETPAPKARDRDRFLDILIRDDGAHRAECLHTMHRPCRACITAVKQRWWILSPGLYRRSDPAFTAFARRHAGTHLDPTEVVARAQTEFLSFVQGIQAACRLGGLMPSEWGVSRSRGGAWAGPLRDPYRRSG